MKLLFVLISLIGVAWGCGGFFCNRQTPVVQEGEKILFSRAEGQDVVQAMISIAYSGPAEDFSWVLPLPSVPEFGVGSDSVFSALMSATEPSFQINWKDGDDCGTQCYLAFGAGGPRVQNDASAEGGEAPKVEVLAEGDVGPFRYQVVFAPSLTGAPMFEWLNDNGYDQPTEAASLINNYASIGNVFVALKLQKNKETGDIQPIVLKYRSPKALSCIPITLTQIAVADNLPIFVWLLGDSRAMPLNYFDVQPDFSAFDWMNCRSLSFDGFFGGSGGGNGGKSCYDKYMDQVRSAINAVGGKGFVTEYAGTTDVLKDRIWSTNSEQRFDKAKLASTSKVGDFLQSLVSMGVPRDATSQALIRAAIPKPAEADLPENCQSDAQFYTFNVDECIQYISNWSFDAAKLADQIDEQLIKPLRDAQALVMSFKTVTRMFSTMTSEQMDRDPFFSFNPDLPDVSMRHEAEGVCDRTNKDKPVATLTFANGVERIVNGTASGCGWDVFPPIGGIGPPVIQVLPQSGAPRAVALGDVTSESQKLGSVDCSQAAGASCTLDGVAFTVPASGPECQAICPGDPADSKCPTCPGSGGNEDNAASFLSGLHVTIMIIVITFIF